MGLPEASRPHVVGRYALYGEIATGGMASVHYGRLLGPAGFSRTVAIKRLHPHLARDREFAAMFLDEARLAARVSHPNVVPMLDVVELADEVLLVMEYVSGASLATLIRASIARGAPVPPDIVSAIVCGVLHGLHAAHEATDEGGLPLGMVHRDVSPQNVQVGTDGVPRVLDFGIAKAQGRMQTTRDGELKGKLAYMSPEQLRGTVDRRTDVYAAAVILWETLTSRRLFTAQSEGELITCVLRGAVDPPSACATGIPEELDAIALRGLASDPQRRFQSAREMALAIETGASVANPTRVARWVEELAGDTLKQRAAEVAEVERVPSVPGTAHEDGTKTALRPTAGSLHPEARTSPSSRARKAALAVVALLIVGSAVVIAALELRARQATPSAANAAAPANAAPSLPARVLVLGIENRTGDPFFDGTLDAVLASALRRSPAIEAYANDRLNMLAGDSQHVDEAVARSLAEREGDTVITVRGTVVSKGSAYTLSLTAKNARTGSVVFSTALDAPELARVVPAAGRLASQLRVALGDASPTEPLLAEQTGMSSSVEADYEFLLGRRLMATARYPEAMAHMTRALALDPAFGKAHTGLGLTLRNAGRFAEGNAELRLAVDDAEALGDRERLALVGSLRVTEEDYRAAAAAYEELLQRFPGDDQAGTALSGVYSAMWNAERSLEVARQAAARSSVRMFRQTNLASAEVFAGHVDAAAEVAAGVIRSNPNPLPHAYSDLAIAEALRGRRDEAREAYGKLLAREALLATAGLADLALAEGRLVEASKLLEPAVTADLSGSNAASMSAIWAMLAETRQALGDRTGAIAASEKASGALAPSVRYAAAMVFLDLHEPKRALALSASLATGEGQDHAVWSRLIEAEVLLATNKPRDAAERIADAQRVVDSWPAHASFARACLALGEFARAETEIRTSMARQGEGAFMFGADAPSVRVVARLPYYLARALDGQRRPEARGMYEAFVAARPSADHDALVADARRRAGGP